MDKLTPAEANSVASRLRVVVYAYVAANIATVILLLSTVTLTPSVPEFEAIGGPEIASLR